MNLIGVQTKEQIREFLEVPKILYRNDDNWVCPLDVEIEGIFNPESNISFKNGEASRWILKDDNGKLIGRIAAFIDYNKAKMYEYKTGGAGFFECIDNQDAANTLFDVAREWLKSKGMEAMQAPINFGENYNYHGLLFEGFKQQSYSMPYNFPYYNKLFEAYGFKNYYEQNSFRKNLKEEVPAHLVKYAEYASSRPGHSFEHFTYKNMDKYIEDFTSTFNKIWSAFHEGYVPLKNEDMRKMLEEARMVIEEKYIWFAYDQGKTTGLVVAFPDINQILKKLKNGKLNLKNKLKLFYYRKRAVTRVRAFIFGISPEYQNSGVMAALFYQLLKEVQSRPSQQELEISWIGDYNPKMLSVFDKFGAKQVFKHATHLYLFDRSAPFKRFDNEFEGKLYR